MIFFDEKKQLIQDDALIKLRNCQEELKMLLATRDYTMSAELFEAAVIEVTTQIINLKEVINNDNKTNDRTIGT